MNTLFFDTETTGLPYRNKPHVHPSQPMPVQLGLKVDADNTMEMNAANILIQTNTVDGFEPWVVSQGAYEATGIDNERADTFGVHLVSAMELFLDMLSTVDTVVAHNINFDIIVMRRAMAVYCEVTGQEYTDPFEDKTLVCTMFASQDIVKAPPKRNGEWKWPKLEECVKHFFGEKLDGAHDALVDVRACARVYYHLHQIGAFQEEFTRRR